MHIVQVKILAWWVILNKTFTIHHRSMGNFMDRVCITPEYVRKKLKKKLTSVTKAAAKCVIFFLRIYQNWPILNYWYIIGPNLKGTM